MHAIYTTPGLIIDSCPYGEAGKLISIFTRDFGLVTASAQGIRFEKSKLRYHAQDRTFGIFSLVRGREFWRLTSASSGDAASSGAASHSAALIARISLLLRRLLQGEEANPALYECVESCGRFLAGEPGLSAEQARTLESLTVLRIIHALGYGAVIPGLPGNDPITASAEAPPALSLAALDAAAPKRDEINRAINKALRESHL